MVSLGKTVGLEGLEVLENRAVENGAGRDGKRLGRKTCWMKMKLQIELRKTASFKPDSDSST